MAKSTSPVKKTEKVLYLVYRENRSGGEICAGDENSDWPMHEDEVIDFNPKYVLFTSHNNLKYRYEYNYYTEIIELPTVITDNDEILYLAIVRYRDGGTFGSTSGYHQIVKASTSEKVVKDFIATFDPDKEYKKDKFNTYQAWHGYFASYEGIEFHKLEIIRKEESNG